jgi:PAS domain S-box-containing protein
MKAQLNLRATAQIRDLHDLRQRALERLREQASAGAAPKPPPAPASGDPRRLLHELQVYQIELEMQNEQLAAACAWIEAALANYTELYDFAPVPYFTLDRTGTIVESNLACARLFGTERARLLDRRFAALVVVSDRYRVAAFLKGVFADQSQACCEAVLLAPDGRRPTVEIHATLAKDGASCRVVLVEVSARCEREAQLARLADAFTFAAEAMFISSNEGIIVDINHAFADLSGYTREQLLGQAVGMLRGDGQAPGLDAAISYALAVGGSWEGPLMYRHRDGSDYQVAEQISLILDRHGMPLRVSRLGRAAPALPA